MPVKDMKSYMRARRLRNNDYDRRRNRDVVARKHKLKLAAIEYKGGKCHRCGGTFDPVCIDFHHIDPSAKDTNIANAMLGKTFDDIRAEIDKCVMVCSNCHRIIHSLEGWKRGKAADGDTNGQGLLFE